MLHGSWSWKLGNYKNATRVNSDFSDLSQCFAKHKVHYLVVGGYAVIHYAQPRFTKDLDLWIEPSITNARKVSRAFYEFGIPLIEVTEVDPAQPGTQFMLGRSPVMLDFLESIPPLQFDACWCRRKRVRHDFGSANYLHREDLITAKRFANRPQDLADIAELIKGNV